MAKSFVILRQLDNQYSQVIPFWLDLIKSAALAFSKGQMIWPFLFGPSPLPMKEDQNIKKSQISSFKGIFE